MASESDTPVEPTSATPAAGGSGSPEWAQAQAAEAASSERILNQDEIDSLLGFDLSDD